jgi:small subunit ribosomal protein S14
MAKKSMIAREAKRTRLSGRDTKRVTIRAALKEAYKDGDARMILKLQTQQKRLKRDSSPCRGRNRCGNTGRPHGYYSLVGLGRNEIYRLAMLGLLPGIMLASW